MIINTINNKLFLNLNFYICYNLFFDEGIIKKKKKKHEIRKLKILEKRILPNEQNIFEKLNDYE